MRMLIRTIYTTWSIRNKITGALAIVWWFGSTRNKRWYSEPNHEGLWRSAAQAKPLTRIGVVAA